jgi:hypothetical protein
MSYQLRRNYLVDFASMIGSVIILTIYLNKIEDGFGNKRERERVIDRKTSTFAFRDELGCNFSGTIPQRRLLIAPQICIN